MDAPNQQDPAPPDHRAEQQRRILAAAITCFARDGFHGASMQKICAEAEMSPGTLYRYFPSKEALIGAIVESERTLRAEIFEHLHQTENVIESLFACAVDMLTDTTMATCQLGPEIMAEAIRNTRLRDAIEPVEQESRDMLRSSLARAKERGEFDASIDLDDLVILLQLLGDGLILNGQLHPEWNLTARLPRLHAMVRRMVEPRGPGAGA